MSERKLTYESERKERPTIYARAKNIASTRRIHQSSVGNIWLVESEKGAGFYSVQYNSVEKRYTCDCPHFTYGVGVAACKHILACLFRLQAKSMLKESD